MSCPPIQMLTFGPPAFFKNKHASKRLISENYSQSCMLYRKDKSYKNTLKFAKKIRIAILFFPQKLVIRDE